MRNKEKSANEVGLKSEVIKYPDTVEEKVILDKIEELNKDDLVSGIWFNCLCQNILINKKLLKP